MFDPSIGKWMTDDPEGFAAGDANLYRYCGNGPTDGVDPTGMDNIPLPATGQMTASRGMTLQLPPPRISKYEEITVWLDGNNVGAHSSFTPDGKVTIIDRVEAGKHTVVVRVDYEDGKIDTGRGEIDVKPFAPDLPSDKVEEKAETAMGLIQDLGDRSYKKRQDADAKLRELTGPLSDNDRRKVLQTGIDQDDQEILFRIKQILSQPFVPSE